MKTILVYRIFLFLSLLAMLTSHAQQVRKAEYFFDNDPGAGNGIPFTIASPSDSVNINQSFSISTLTAGFHVLGIRVYGNTTFRNSTISYTTSFTGVPTISGVTSILGSSWSFPEYRRFYIASPATTITNTKLVAGEYFFDTDPGVGNGIPTNAFPLTDSININNNINISSLSVGYHTIGLRFKNSQGIWGHYETRSFYVAPILTVNTLPGIVSAEYFFDTDPGTGNGFKLSNISQLDSLTVNAQISVVGLNAGYHTISIRTKDRRGVWSIFETRTFYIPPTIANTSVSGIVAAEYFFDNDPGIGNGIPINTGLISDSINLSSVNIPLMNLSSGFHNLFVRIKGSNSQWSHYEGRRFYVQPTVPSPINDPIDYAEYFFNRNDPGNGKATPITIPTIGDSINVTTLINASVNNVPLAFGIDTLNVRVRTKSGKYSMASSKTFAVCQTAPQASFSFDTVCVGSPTRFINSTTGFNGLTTFAWDFDNNGSINSTVAGSVNYTYPSPGTYTAKLTVSNQGACFTTATGQVLVVASVPAQPSIISGNVQVCKGVQKYSIQAVNATKYAWNTPSLGTIQINSRRDSVTVNWTGIGTDVLQVVPSNACGSGLAQTLPIQVNNTLLNASAGPDYSICQGDSVVLNASGGSSFLWINQNLTTSGIKVKPNTTTAYIVKVSQGGCNAFDTTFVVVSATPPQPIVTQKGDTLITNIVNGASYQWYLGSLKVGNNSNKYKPAYSGTYFVKVSVGTCSPPQSPDYNFVTTITCIPQTIIFNSIPQKLDTDPPFALLASVTSGLPISFSISGNAATILGNGMVSILGVGASVITASQIGNPTYCSASSVSQILQVVKQTNSKLPQSISFAKLNNVFIDNPPIPLQATASSGLPVKFSLISGPASIVGNNIVLNSTPGIVVVKASQSGDSTFSAATDSVQVFYVFNYTTNPLRQPQQITFYGVADRQIDAAPIKLIGSATSGLKVDFIVTSGPAYVRNDTLYTTAIGRVVLKAYQHGNALFLPADSILSSFTVTEIGCPFLPASPVVTTNTPLCTGDNLIVKSSFIPDGVYVWEGPNNFTSTGQNFTILGVNDFNAGNYKVTVSVGNCKSLPTFTKIDVYITPDKPTLNVQSSTFCQNNAVLSVPDVYGAYKWHLDSYTIANANEHTYSPGIKGNYYVRVYDSTKTCSNVSNTFTYNGTGTNGVPQISSLNDETTLQSSTALKYQWYLDKRLILGANAQSISVLYNGNYKVYVTYDDSCKLVSSNYTINKGFLNSIERSGAVFTDSTIFWNQAKENYLAIIPNPADGYFKVSYYSSQNGKVFSEVFNASGSLIASKTLEYNGLEYSTTFITEGWKSGVFMVKIIDGTQVKWAKVVIY